MAKKTIFLFRFTITRQPVGPDNSRGFNHQRAIDLADDISHLAIKEQEN